MGMTLAVYRTDKYFDGTVPHDEKYIGGIPLKFYGYTDISEMASCKYLASLSDEPPVALNYFFIYRTNPRVSLNKDETITFITLFAADCVLWTKSRFHDRVDPGILCAAAELLKTVRDTDTDEFELCWY